MDKSKRKQQVYHFRGHWKNGDPLVIASYGYSKNDAFSKMLKARKEKKYRYRQGDGFTMTNFTNEEHHDILKQRGYDDNSANWLSGYAHTCYIVKDGKVEIN